MTFCVAQKCIDCYSDNGVNMFAFPHDIAAFVGVARGSGVDHGRRGAAGDGPTK